MSSRVSVGDLKGLVISPIPSHVVSNAVGLRPTTAMARSVLFNVLQHNAHCSHLVLSELSVLDLCCGSGIVGIEFASIGARKVSFVDGNAEVLCLLKKNLSCISLECDIETSLYWLPKSFDNDVFDVIFFDPPYHDNGLLAKQMLLIFSNKALSKDGVIIVELDKTASVGVFEGFECFLDRRVNSKTKLLFYRYCSS